MKYIIETKKNMEQACSDLSSSVVKHGFGVLHIHDLYATLNKKGVPFENPCRVFEVCNPSKAQAVMTYDMTLNMALPCRISVWEVKGVVKIGMISPKSMLSLLSQAEEFLVMAQEVETTLKQIIDEAA